MFVSLKENTFFLIFYLLLKCKVIQHRVLILNLILTVIHLDFNF
jgi:hypothetical protein